MSQTKLGKGGYGQQQIDDEGKYVSETSFSDDDVINVINQNPQYKDLYDKMDDNGKKAVIDKLKGMLTERKTNKRMEQRFSQISASEFTYYSNECNNTICDKYPEENYQSYDGKTYSHYEDAFHRGYKAAGQKAFNFNKALRLGWKVYEQWQNSQLAMGEMASYQALTEQEVIDRTNKLDKITTAWQTPKDMGGYRLLDENYIVSMFEPFVRHLGITVDQWGYKSLDRKKVSIDDLYNCLSNCVGRKIKSDGGFTSVSMVNDASHMMRKASVDDYKRIEIKYAIPKGKNIYMSGYNYESEAVFPRGTQFFIQDIKKEKGADGNERVVLYYGVQ